MTTRTAAMRLSPATVAAGDGRSAEHWQSVAFEAAAALALVAETDALASARSKTDEARGVVEVDRVAWLWRGAAIHAAGRLLDRLELGDGLPLGRKTESYRQASPSA